MSNEPGSPQLRILYIPGAPIHFPWGDLPADTREITLESFRKIKNKIPKENGRYIDLEVWPQIKRAWYVAK